MTFNHSFPTITHTPDEFRKLVVLFLREKLVTAQACQHVCPAFPSALCSAPNTGYLKNVLPVTPRSSSSLRKIDTTWEKAPPLATARAADMSSEAINTISWRTLNKWLQQYVCTEEIRQKNMYRLNKPCTTKKEQSHYCQLKGTEHRMKALTIRYW
jgi:hypothetical protein